MNQSAELSKHLPEGTEIRISNYKPLEPLSALAGTQLSVLKKSVGELRFQALILNLLIEMKGYVKINVSEDVLLNWSEMIGKDYWYLKMPELLNVFNNGISGKYGKIYGELMYSDVCNWIRQYEQEKAYALEMKVNSEKERADNNRNSVKSLRQLLSEKK